MTDLTNPTNLRQWADEATSSLEAEGYRMAALTIEQLEKQRDQLKAHIQHISDAFYADYSDKTKPADYLCCEAVESALLKAPKEPLKEIQAQAIVSFVEWAWETGRVYEGDDHDYISLTMPDIENYTDRLRNQDAHKRSTY